MEFFVNFCVRHILDLAHQFQVLGRGHVRVEIGVLDDRADALERLVGGMGAVKPFKVTGGGVYDIEHHAQRGGLAASVGAQYAVHIAFFYRKGKVAYGLNFTKTFGQAV